MSIWQSLANSAHEMARSAFSNINTLEDWQRARADIHRQFLHGLGLDPMPPRCDLKITEHGTFAGEGYEARKIAFQIMPDCWSTAIVYYPAGPGATARPAPGVLYVCGHAPIGTLHYQPHGMMWARRGYVCLTVDTIEQHDNPGEHHGTNNGDIQRWLAMGYSAAGGEVWNSLRALDVLAADRRVDPRRLGVTGVSGGGSLSFLTAVADDRIKAVSTLCGVSPVVDAIANRRVMNNCDCFYPRNVHQHDTSVHAALLAPRAAMFCYALDDQLFYISEIRAMVDRTRRIFELHGFADRCELVTCPGPHGDHVEFDEATARWFDKHVAGEPRPAVPRGKAERTEAQMTVFNGTPPIPNHVELLPDLLSPPGNVPLPNGTGDWPAIRKQAINTLLARVPGLAPTRRPQGGMAQTGDWCWGTTTRMREHRGEAAGIELWLNIVSGQDLKQKMVVCVANEGESAMNGLARLTTGLDVADTAYGSFEPRIGGFKAPASLPRTAPKGGGYPPAAAFLLSAMALTGMTPVMMTIHDIAILVDYLKQHEQYRQRPLYLFGKGDGAMAALYAALLDDRIAGVILQDLPCSHVESSPILGVRRAFDVPHAVGLMAPRKVALVGAGHNNWNWPARAYARLQASPGFVRTEDPREAFGKILA